MFRRPRRVTAAAATSSLLAAGLTVAVPATPAVSATAPSGFGDTVVLDDLQAPTSVGFADDGRVFVAEKRGVVKQFDSLADDDPTVVADLRTSTFNYLDRGLLSLALDPEFPERPYLYVGYTHDAAIGGQAPRWGRPGADDDVCPSPPGPNRDGCVVSNRVSRLRLDGDTVTGERVLVEDWCQQYSSHSIGSLAFGPDGALYASGGDGSSFGFADYGQDGYEASDVTPDNPCGDPPSRVGTALTAPRAEGGSLRSQDLRTSGDPMGLDGTVIRIDPDTGAGLPDNPRGKAADPNLRRVVAAGLRNPFRMTVRPGTGELWLGDVGWRRFEEVNRIADVRGTVDNFGWPCYEGTGRQSGYDNADLDICEDLYRDGPSAVVRPYASYDHEEHVVRGDGCSPGSSSVSGVAFYDGGTYPDAYDGALFFADGTRGCVWAMMPGADGLPDPNRLRPFVTDATYPVELRTGPGGDLYYVDIAGPEGTGSVHRVRYSDGNTPPVAKVTATPDEGSSPLPVTLDASGSFDLDDDPLSYAWDLDGDGDFDDAFEVSPTWTYESAGVVRPRVRVTDGHGGASTASARVLVDTHAPRAQVEAPTEAETWAAGDTVPFAGSATDEQDGVLPDSALTWTLVLHHCPGTCHEHVVTRYSGTSSGTFDAPDHEYPAHLELRLTARDSDGLTDTRSVTLQPETTDVTVDTSPSHLDATLGPTTLPGPFVETVIAGSGSSLSAPTPQRDARGVHDFAGWSDGGARTHNVTVGDAPTSFTARFDTTPLARLAPTAPVRLANTRTGYRTPSRRLGPGATRDLVVAGHGGVPADATAVAVTLTATGATRSTGLKAYPTGAGVPAGLTSAVRRGEPVTTTAVVKVGTDGRIRLRNARGRVHVVADVVGFARPATATLPGTVLQPRTPARLMNTRTGLATAKGRIGPGGSRPVSVTGRHGVPADATAALVTLTTSAASRHSALKAYAAGGPVPAGGVLQARKGRTVSTTTLVRIGADGRVRLRNTRGRVHVAADLVGFARPATDRHPGSVYTPRTPRRVMSTATGLNTGRGRIGPGKVRDLALAGRYGVPADATAAVVTVVAHRASRRTSVRAYPRGAAVPTGSTTHLGSGRRVVTTAVVKIGTDGRVRLRNTRGYVHVAVDLAGYVR